MKKESRPSNTDPTGYWNQLGVKYSPDQPRDEQGRWTGDGSPSPSAPAHEEIVNTAKVGSMSIRRTHDESAKLLAGYYKIATPDLQKIFKGAFKHNVELEIKKGSVNSGKRSPDVTVIARWKDDKGNQVARQHTTFSDAGGMKYFIPQEIEVHKAELNNNKSYWTQVAKSVRESLTGRSEYYVNPTGIYVWPTTKEKISR